MPNNRGSSPIVTQTYLGHSYYTSDTTSCPHSHRVNLPHRNIKFQIPYALGPINAALRNSEHAPKPHLTFTVVQEVIVGLAHSSSPLELLWLRKWGQNRLSRKPPPTQVLGAPSVQTQEQSLKLNKAARPGKDIPFHHDHRLCRMTPTATILCTSTRTSDFASVLSVTAKTKGQRQSRCQSQTSQGHSSTNKLKYFGICQRDHPWSREMLNGLAR